MVKIKVTEKGTYKSKYIAFPSVPHKGEYILFDEYEDNDIECVVLDVKYYSRPIPYDEVEEVYFIEIEVEYSR